MLTRIDLEQFKCFTSLRLPLHPLTLLSGGNASGKSSVLQALILLHQAIRENGSTNRLKLNGSIIQLGTVFDVVNQMHGRDGFEIGLEFSQDNEVSRSVEYIVKCRGARKDSDMELSIMEEETEQDIENFRDIQDMQGLHNLTYLTAERLGPRKMYDLLTTSNNIENRALKNVGPRGEYTASVLHTRGDYEILDQLIVEPEAMKTLRAQVSARMTDFFPGFEYAVEKVPNVDSVILGLRISKHTELHSPINTGFGLTQVLPIVVAALSANSGDMLLIENPEVHLHPAGQSAMGEFLAEVAAAGVQVILETHSDHILNGIRRAIKDGLLLPKDTALYFFRPQHGEEMDDSRQVQRIGIDADGNLDDWPDGFFDQFDKDLNYFAGWL